MKNVGLTRGILLSLASFLAAQFLWGCQPQQKIPAPPFSMDSLATLYVQSKLRQTVSLPDSLKEESLAILFQNHSITNDSLQTILNYFKNTPNAWLVFYEKVNALTEGQKKSR